MPTALRLDSMRLTLIKNITGTSPDVQLRHWLRHCDSNAGLIPGGGTKIPHVVWHGQKKKKKKKKLQNTSEIVQLLQVVLKSDTELEE